MYVNVPTCSRTDRQIGRQKQANWHTYRQADIKAYIQRGRQEATQADRQNNKQAQANNQAVPNIHTDRQAHKRAAGSQTGRTTHIQTYMQTDRHWQANRQTDRVYVYI